MEQEGAVLRALHAQKSLVALSDLGFHHACCEFGCWRIPGETGELRRGFDVIPKKERFNGDCALFQRLEVQSPSFTEMRVL